MINEGNTILIFSLPSIATVCPPLSLPLFYTVSSPPTHPSLCSLPASADSFKSADVLIMFQSLHKQVEKEFLSSLISSKWTIRAWVGLWTVKDRACHLLQLSKDYILLVTECKETCSHVEFSLALTIFPIDSMMWKKDTFISIFLSKSVELWWLGALIFPFISEQRKTTVVQWI